MQILKMNFLKFIKHIFFFFLTFLLGAQTTCAKTKLVLPQNVISFSTDNYRNEQNQNFNNLKKEVQPNIGFLFRKFSEEKSKFEVSEGVSFHNQHKFSESLCWNLVNAGSRWLDDLESLLGPGSKTKIQGWLNEGLDAGKVKLSFANTSNKTNLFNKLDNAKSIQHQRVLTNDLDNIPGVNSGQYISNSVDNVTQNITKTANNKQFILKPYQAETFQKNASLINRADIEIIEDLNNGIQLVKVKPGTKLYRVYDGYQQGVNTLPKGNYWTFEKPSSISEVIGGSAVQPEWNSMIKYIEIEVPSQGIYVWRGKAAKQPLSNNENITNYFLQGGTEQLIFDINQNAISIPSITNSITKTP